MNIPWDSCEVRFAITNPVAVRSIGTCPELPLGWVVGTVEPDDKRHGWRLVFEVQGETLIADGQTVQRILSRAGAFT